MLNEDVIQVQFERGRKSIIYFRHILKEIKKICQ